ncbi:MAG: sensor histidine kinase [Acidimicrobiales bacterium]
MPRLRRLAAIVRSGPDVVLLLALAAAVASDTARAASAGSNWPLDLAVDVVIGATAVLRSRNRSWAVAVGLALFAVATMVPEGLGFNAGPVQAGRWVALLVLAASTARWVAPHRAAWLAVVGVVVVAVGQSSHGTGSFKPSALDALSSVTLWASALAVGAWLRSLDRRHDAALDAVRRNERLELARELHDLVAHHVTGMVVQAQAASFASKDDPEPLLAALASIEVAGSETLTAIRRLVGLLRDPDDTAGVSSAPEPIDQLVERFGRHGPAVDLRLPTELTANTWPGEVATTVYRVVQEALTNVARHAPEAHSVTVTVTHDPDRVGVEVTNDAPAPPLPARIPSGYGLVGMRERVEALGGQLHAGPLADAGWAVHASLPLPARTGP